MIDFLYHCTNSSNRRTKDRDCWIVSMRHDGHTETLTSVQVESSKDSFSDNEIDNRGFGTKSGFSIIVISYTDTIYTHNGMWVWVSV